MGAMQTIEHAQSKTYKFSFPIPYKSQCNAHQGNFTIGMVGKPSTLY